MSALAEEVDFDELYAVMRPTPQELAASEALVKQEAARDEWEAYTLREIEERLAEMEEGDEADNYLLN